MRYTCPQYSRRLAVLLNRSAKFLSSLVCGTPQSEQKSSVSFGINLSWFQGKGLGNKQPKQQWLGDLLSSGESAQLLLGTRSHTTELWASLATAFFLKPHRNNSVTHSMDGESLASLEKDVTDMVARLLGLPTSFLWVPRVEGRHTGEREIISSLPHPVTSSPEVPSIQSCVPAVSGCSSKSVGNDSNGGGLLHSSLMESLIIVLTTARAQAYTRYLSARFSSPEDQARVSQRLVLYCSDQCQPLLKRAARCVGIHHVRTLQTVYSPFVHNYPMQLNMLKAAVAEDVSHGLYPLLVSGVFGARTTGAVDPLEEIAEFCRRVKLWFHIDASHSGLALAATVTQQCGAEQTLPLGSVEGKDGIIERMWEQQAVMFRKAARHADSIHFGLSTSFLPTLSANSPASLLYVANVKKVKFTMQQMNVDDEGVGNMWCTPTVTDISIMRLDNPEMRSSEIIRLAVTLRQSNCVSIGCVVRKHQEALHYLGQRLRADGRFDCSVDASCFGMVLFRWLTLADEETVALMQRWTNTYTVACLKGDDTKTHSLPCMSLGLTKIQRRMYICVGLAAGYNDGGGSDSDENNNDNGYLDRHDIDTLMESLKAAASEWDDVSKGT